MAQFTQGSNQTRAAGRSSTGTALQDRGDLDDAADCYHGIIPRPDEPRPQLGHAQEQRQFDDAIRCFSTTRCGSRCTTPTRRLTNCYMQMDDGRTIATTVPPTHDTCAIGHYNLGSACHARRDLDRLRTSRHHILELGHAATSTPHRPSGAGEARGGSRCYDEAACLDSTADAAAAATSSKGAERRRTKGANRAGHMTGC